MVISPEDLSRILLAILVGGCIGFERELHQKAAGFRTITLICVGSALFSMLSLKIEGNTGRIIANIVTGVGFLGAGVVFREANRITGLTTSATIWLVAALGMGIGAGHYLLSLVTAGCILIVLILFPLFEKWIGKLWETRNYRIVVPNQPDNITHLENLINQCKLHKNSHRLSKRGVDLLCNWQVTGCTKNHEAFSMLLINDPMIIEFES